MKKIVGIVLVMVILLSLSATVFAASYYTSFDIVFEIKDGEKVNETEIKVFAAVDEGLLIDRTNEFTLEDVEWFKYLPEPEEGKTAEDYDYVDEAINVYGMLCLDDDVFELDKYSYFLRIARLYAQEEDTFDRNVTINGVDIEELNGLCFNTGNEFYIKTITNGHGGPSTEEDPTQEPDINPDKTPETTPDDNKPTKNKCKVCGICPVQPLGICLFIWIAIIIVVVIIVVIVLKKKKDNDKKENK